MVNEKICKSKGKYYEFSKKKIRRKTSLSQHGIRSVEEVKAIEFCLCRRIYRLGSNRENAFEYGTAKAKEKFQGEKINFSLLHDEMKNVLDEAALDGEKCPNCEM